MIYTRVYLTVNLINDILFLPLWNIILNLSPVFNRDYGKRQFLFLKCNLEKKHGILSINRIFNSDRLSSLLGRRSRHYPNSLLYT